MGDAPPLMLDGSHGEGGGQIVRTALALAVAVGRAVTITRIRAGRRQPGLRPQHLTVVRALAAISEAEVTGDHLGSMDLAFVPRALRGGVYRFDVGSAGSVTLLFQALALPLTRADEPSVVTLIGGTHVPWSPPLHFVTEVLLPSLRPAGLDASVGLRRWGWYPAGGGEIEARIQPASLRGIVLERARSALTITGVSAVSRLPRSIAERQRQRALERLGAAGLAADIVIEEDATARGPGTMLFLAVPGRAGFFALGRRGLPAERVADAAVDELLAWATSGAAVDDHLADQLVPFLALGGSASTFTSPTVSRHLRTVAWVVEQLLPVKIALEDGSPARVGIVPLEIARAG